MDEAFGLGGVFVEGFEVGEEEVEVGGHGREQDQAGELRDFW